MLEIKQLEDVLNSKNFPGRDINIKVKELIENRQTFTSIISPDAINSLKAYGINAKELIDNHMIDTLIDNIYRYISQRSFENPAVTKKIKDTKDVKNLIDTLNNKKGFAITNVQTATMLQDHPSFVHTYLNSEYGNSFYKLGKFNKVSIYVDANMIWDDNKICYISDDFYNFNVLSIDIIAESTYTPKYKITLFYTENPKNNEVYNLTLKTPFIPFIYEHI